jgi:hypothetical protein
MAADCVSADCKNGVCQPPPTCTDGIKNGSESTIDCGGPTCPPCANGKTCSTALDCDSALCTSGAGAICRQEDFCGSDINGTCLCAIHAGTCISKAPNNLADSNDPFRVRTDCDCGARTCDPGLICVTFDEGPRCMPRCGSSEVCNTADLCRVGTSGSFCGRRGGFCLQPVGGGRTRCGFSASKYGCQSDGDCAAGQFCVTFDPNGGGGCTCGGPTTFCARPL